jgi:patatin-like phospholipase/acyl hydrolase
MPTFASICANGFFATLDDSGVNGLAILYVIKDMMVKVNGKCTKASLSPLQTFEVFDLIGGTGLGG